MMKEVKEGFRILIFVLIQRQYAQRGAKDQKKLGGSPDCSNG